MGVTDFEIEPVDEWEGFCSVHECYYWHEHRCMGCSSDEADRQYDERKERLCP